MKKRYIVCNIDGSTNQKRFRIHETFSEAVIEANRLAAENSGNQFMVMETVGGFILRGDRVEPLEVADG